MEQLLLFEAREKSGYEMTPDEIRAMPNSNFSLKHIRAIEWLSDFDNVFPQIEDALIQADEDGEVALRNKYQTECDEIVMRFLGIKYKWVNYEPIPITKIA